MKHLLVLSPAEMHTLAKLLPILAEKAIPVPAKAARGLSRCHGLLTADVDLILGEPEGYDKKTRDEVGDGLEIVRTVERALR